MGSISPPSAPSVHPLKTLKLDAEGIARKYSEERAKRLRDDGIRQFKASHEGAYSRFKDDPLATITPRDPIRTETTVVIVGGGFAGLITAVELKSRGVEDFLIIDRAGGFGGTWYWNQYPGASCDLESLIYLPFLEETGYTPTGRFPPAREILEHCDRIVSKWNLAAHAHFHTSITSAAWNEPTRRWHIHTDRSDDITAQFVVLATGTFHEPKLPGVAGIETFERPHFHNGRWDYAITGGSPTSSIANTRLTKLADKTVGLIGTGCSAVQLVPYLARDAGKLLVFQRTPSTVTPRAVWDTDENLLQLGRKEQGWQRREMERFANIMQGDDTSDEVCSAVEGFDALTMQAVVREARLAGVELPKPEEVPELLGLADLWLMERLRRIVDDTVLDKPTAERLKPWYSFFCKRPAFSNDYYAAFNRPNVELVDTDGKGVSRLTRTGVVVADGREYEVDVLVYATGFDFEIGSDFYRRTGIHLTGTRGQTPDQKWEEAGGPSTLFGIHSRGFPNLFTIGPAQAGVTANWTHTAHVAGEHIAEIVAGLVRDGTYQAIEPTVEAEEDWGKRVEEGSEMRQQFGKTCSPGYNNKEGKPEEIPARWAFYPKGIVVWEKLMKEWREEGSMKGIETVTRDQGVNSWGSLARYRQRLSPFQHWM